MAFQQGDIVSINFDPSKGHEPAKRRPAIVVSSSKVNLMTNLTLLAPVTSTDNGFPLHVPLGQNNAIEGFAQCEALRALDLQSRSGVEHLGEVDDLTLSAILEAVGVVVGI
jgi:mRNA interferase MazF